MFKICFHVYQNLSCCTIPGIRLYEEQTLCSMCSNDISSVIPVSCSSPRWDNLPSEHQRNPLLGLKLRYMYWGQNEFSEKIETYQYMQKKEVNVLMVFFFLVYW